MHKVFNECGLEELLEMKGHDVPMNYALTVFPNKQTWSKSTADMPWVLV